MLEMGETTTQNKEDVMSKSVRSKAKPYSQLSLTVDDGDLEEFKAGAEAEDLTVQKYILRMAKRAQDGKVGENSEITDALTAIQDDLKELKAQYDIIIKHFIEKR